MRMFMMSLGSASEPLLLNAAIRRGVRCHEHRPLCTDFHSIGWAMTLIVVCITSRLVHLIMSLSRHEPYAIYQHAPITEAMPMAHFDPVTVTVARCLGRLGVPLRPLLLSARRVRSRSVTVHCSPLLPSAQVRGTFPKRHTADTRPMSFLVVFQLAAKRARRKRERARNDDRLRFGSDGQSRVPWRSMERHDQ